jgi:hypothetical protein
MKAGEHLLLVWACWFLGPVCFSLCAVFHDGEPNCLLALLAVVGQGAAVALTIVMTASARFQPTLEYCCMVLYWVPLAGLALGFATASPLLWRVSMFAVLGWVALVPLAGAMRLVLALRRVGKSG